MNNIIKNLFGSKSRRSSRGEKLKRGLNFLRRKKDQSGREGGKKETPPLDIKTLMKQIRINQVMDKQENVTYSETLALSPSGTSEGKKAVKEAILTEDSRMADFGIIEEDEEFSYQDLADDLFPGPKKTNKGAILERGDSAFTFGKPQD